MASGSTEERREHGAGAGTSPQTEREREGEGRWRSKMNTITTEVGERWEV